MWAITIFLIVVIVCATVLLYKFMDVLADAGELPPFAKKDKDCDECKYNSNTDFTDGIQ